MFVVNFFWKNRQSFYLAFFLSVAIWVSTVISNDPNMQEVLTNEIKLNVIGLADDLVIVSDYPENIDVEILAPQSVWEEVNQNSHLVSSTLDLTSLESGVYTLDISVKVDANPAEIINFYPSTLEVQIENFSTTEWPIKISVRGETALGFEAELPIANVSKALASGPDSIISQIDTIVAEIEISGVRESLTQSIALVPYDINGQILDGVEISPKNITINQKIIQSGGYRDVAVIVETVGEPEKGYRVTNISKFPTTVTLFSSDPVIVAEMPGFVSTIPLDLTDANDDINSLLTLDLPEGVSLVGEDQAISVQIGISAIEDTIMLEVPVEIIGLGSLLSAELSPKIIEVFLSGPLSVLDELLPTDIHIFVNLIDLQIGSFLVEPEEEVIPTRLTLEGINPDTIEVIISVLVEDNSSTSESNP